MNVLYLYDGRWPHNATRVGKQVTALLAAGHKVTILSRGKPGEPRAETDGDLSVIRLPSFHSKLADRLVSYPIFLNPLWVQSIRTHARRSRADCIVVRDLPLAPAALHFGANEGLPVHYDMAEVYPAYVHTVLPHESGPFMRVVQATGAADTIERWVVHRATTTFVVSEESRDRCAALGVPRDRIVLVGNTPANPEALLADWPRPDDVKDLEGRPTALFVGNLFADRGLRYAIDAIKIVARELPSAVLVIVGDGRERPILEAQVAREDVSDHVGFLGWKHHRDHPPYLRHAQVGILPFLATEHIRITLANKLFDYMGAGLPVLASDVPPMRRVLDETNSGLLAPAADAGALATELLRLFNDDALRARLGANGRAAIANQYAWRNDAARFVAAIEGASRARAAS